MLPSIEGDLARVEAELRSSVSSTDSFLTQIASHLMRAGGKRVRPGFAIVCASSLDPEATSVPLDVIRGATAVELVHIGSLYHDDVMDEATTRRTVRSVNSEFGNLRAILAGDFLLARASEIAASLGVEVAGLLASTIAKLCEGQIGELEDAYSLTRTETSYLSSIEGKTASLVATACRVGGLVAELPRDIIDTLTTFGHSYGMAFQVIDDILDLVASDEQLGKPAGNDLVEGTYTLPVIHTLRTEAGADLHHILGGPIDSTERDKARDIVRINGGIEYALDVAVRFANDAAGSLEPLGDTPAANALRAASDHLIGRVAEFC